MANDSSVKAFKCPTCGAPLEPQAGALTMKCNYCGGTVIIPQSLRTPAPGSSSSVPQYHWGGLDLSEIVGEAMRLPEAISLAEQGRIDEAAQLYSQITGSNITDATKAIQEIVAGKAVSLSPGQAGMQWGQTPSSTTNMGAGSYNPYPQFGGTFTTPTFTPTPTIYSQPMRRGLFMSSGFWIFFTIVIVGITLCATLAPFGAIIPALFSSGLFSSSSPSSSNPSSSGNNAIATMMAIATNIPQGLNGAASNGFAKQTLNFGSKGIGQGMFTDARAVTVDGNGNIIVGDFQDGRIQIFDPSGKYVSTIALGNKVGIDSLAASHDGKIYAAHQGKISVYDSTGKDIQDIRNDQLYFNAIALGPDGTLYATTDDDTIVHFNQNGKINLQITKAFENVTGNGESDAAIAVDGLGNIYAVGTSNYLVFKFTPDGKYVNQFGGESNGDNQNGKFDEPSGIAVDGYGRVYVSDIFGNVQVFDSSGAYLNNIPAEGYGISIDNQNNAYVTLSDKVVKYQVQKP
jgi:DNA-directed RNA polymerase subunit RPC12/RpoP/streptogramin lyase